MSRDQQRGNDVAHVDSRSAVADLLGGREQVPLILERLFQVGQAQPAAGIPELDGKAAVCRHAIAGFCATDAMSSLPRNEVQRGYHWVWAALNAARQRKSLPDHIQAVIAACRADARDASDPGDVARQVLQCTPGLIDRANAVRPLRRVRGIAAQRLDAEQAYAISICRQAGVAQ